jgi:cobalt-zinc-cadmium efflux system outer membrane protein
MGLGFALTNKRHKNHSQQTIGGTMSKHSKILATIAAILFGILRPAAAQDPPMKMDMSEDHTHHHQGAIEPVAPVFPRMGRAQESVQGPLFTLEQAQRLAEQSNPTLRQAEVEIRAAKARRLQAGLYPNPTFGYTGDEIRGGSVGGGKQGFFLEQTFVTAGKLSKSAEVYSEETHLAEIEAEEQKIRVQTSVKAAFIRVLAAQELLDAATDLANIERDYAEAKRQLFNTGQMDETEVLEAELDAQHMRLASRMQENSLREEWRSLTAVLGQPDIPPAIVAGDLEHNWPEIQENEAVESIVSKSPAAQIANVAALRAQADFLSARSQRVPDIQVRGGLIYNNETLGSAPYAKGWEGIAEVSVPIQIFNHNQGNIAASSASSRRAQLEKQRVALTLRERAASVVDQYANAKLMAVEYRDHLLPLSRKSYGLMVEKYGLMLASHPRVLESQRKLYRLQAEYIIALEGVWLSGLSLEGYLLTDGLESPARPAEVDRPIRETNMPLPERMGFSRSISPMP